MEDNDNLTDKEFTIALVIVFLLLNCGALAWLAFLHDIIGTQILGCRGDVGCELGTQMAANNWYLQSLVAWAIGLLIFGIAAAIAKSFR